jgi:chromosome segregation ATPase
MPNPNWTKNDELLTVDPDERLTMEDIGLKVQEAQTALLDLKRQQEEIERQKRELEELGRKQREFEEGRRDIFEKMTRGLVVIERQESEMQRELDQLGTIRESFNDHISQIERIRPQDWSPKDLQSELTRALAIIDQANSIYHQARSRLDILREEQGEAALDEMPALNPALMPKSFGQSFREGFAFTLPLILFGLIALLILLATRH